MPGQIKVGGAWKVYTPYIRVGGVWKKAKEGWIKVSGTWRRWWVAETPFAYTGSLQTFIVPTGTTSITVDMAGAAGGGNSNTVPGGGRNGHRVQATIPVTPGQTLHIAVGGGGIGNFTCAGTEPTYGSRDGGWPGGGNSGSPTWYYFPSCISTGGSGGGYSGIFTSSTLSQANALLIAGGGGGIGVGTAPSSLNGANGTTSSGGARGTSNGSGNNDHTNGSALQGGRGEGNAYSPNTLPAAGGGGGYFGGGGGAAGSFNSGAGGDGSSWTHASATSVTLTSNYQAGNGYVIIS